MPRVPYEGDLVHHKSINHKRVQRSKKRKIKMGCSVACQAEHPNHVWSYDFQADALLSGRQVRLLNIRDELGVTQLNAK